MIFSAKVSKIAHYLRRVHALLNEAILRAITGGGQFALSSLEISWATAATSLIQVARHVFPSGAS
jgi:hypothetical protein